MLSNGEIVNALAKERRVEAMVQNIAHQPLNDDLKDLSQIVYKTILEYRADKVAELYETGQINFFIARIIINQFRSSSSPFHHMFRKFRERTCSIAGLDWEAP